MEPESEEPSPARRRRREDGAGGGRAPPRRRRREARGADAVDPPRRAVVPANLNVVEFPPAQQAFLVQWFQRHVDALDVYNYAMPPGIHGAPPSIPDPRSYVMRILQIAAMFRYEYMERVRGNVVVVNTPQFPRAPLLQYLESLVRDTRARRFLYGFRDFRERNLIRWEEPDPDNVDLWEENTPFAQTDLGVVFYMLAGTRDPGPMADGGRRPYRFDFFAHVEDRRLGPETSAWYQEQIRAPYRGPPLSPMQEYLRAMVRDLWEHINEDLRDDLSVENMVTGEALAYLAPHDSHRFPRWGAPLPVGTDPAGFRTNPPTELMIRQFQHTWDRIHGGPGVVPPGLRVQVFPDGRMYDPLANLYQDAETLEVPAGFSPSPFVRLPAAPASPPSSGEPDEPHWDNQPPDEGPDEPPPPPGPPRDGAPVVPPEGDVTLYTTDVPGTVGRRFSNACFWRTLMLLTGHTRADTLNDDKLEAFLNQFWAHAETLLQRYENEREVEFRDEMDEVYREGRLPDRFPAVYRQALARFRNLDRTNPDPEFRGRRNLLAEDFHFLVATHWLQRALVIQVNYHAEGREHPAWLYRWRRDDYGATINRILRRHQQRPLFIRWDYHPDGWGDHFAPLIPDRNITDQQWTRIVRTLLAGRTNEPLPVRIQAVAPDRLFTPPLLPAFGTPADAAAVAEPSAPGEAQPSVESTEPTPPEGQPEPEPQPEAPSPSPEPVVDRAPVVNPLDRQRPSFATLTEDLDIPPNVRVELARIFDADPATWSPFFRNPHGRGATPRVFANYRDLIKQIRSRYDPYVPRWVPSDRPQPELQPGNEAAPQIFPPRLTRAQAAQQRVDALRTQRAEGPREQRSSLGRMAQQTRRPVNDIRQDLETRSRLYMEEQRQQRRNERRAGQAPMTVEAGLPVPEVSEYDLLHPPPYGIDPLLNPPSLLDEPLLLPDLISAPSEPVPKPKPKPKPPPIDPLPRRSPEDPPPDDDPTGGSGGPSPGGGGVAISGKTTSPSGSDEASSSNQPPSGSRPPSKGSAPPKDDRLLAAQQSFHKHRKQLTRQWDRVRQGLHEQAQRAGDLLERWQHTPPADLPTRFRLVEELRDTQRRIGQLYGELVRLRDAQEALQPDQKQLRHILTQIQTDEEAAPWMAVGREIQGILELPLTEALTELQRLQETVLGVLPTLQQANKSVVAAAPVEEAEREPEDAEDEADAVNRQMVRELMMEFDRTDEPPAPVPEEAPPAAAPLPVPRLVPRKEVRPFTVPPVRSGTVPQPSATPAVGPSQPKGFTFTAPGQPQPNPGPGTVTGELRRPPPDDRDTYMVPVETTGGAPPDPPNPGPAPGLEVQRPPPKAPAEARDTYMVPVETLPKSEPLPPPKPDSNPPPKPDPNRPSQPKSTPPPIKPESVRPTRPAPVSRPVPSDPVLSEVTASGARSTGFDPAGDILDPRRCRHQLFAAFRNAFLRAWSADPLWPREAGSVVPSRFLDR